MTHPSARRRPEHEHRWRCGLCRPLHGERGPRRDHHLWTPHQARGVLNHWALRRSGTGKEARAPHGAEHLVRHVPHRYLPLNPRLARTWPESTLGPRAAGSKADAAGAPPDLAAAGPGAAGDGVDAAAAAARWWDDQLGVTVASFRVRFTGRCAARGRHGGGSGCRRVQCVFAGCGSGRASAPAGSAAAWAWPLGCVGGVTGPRCSPQVCFSTACPRPRPVTLFLRPPRACRACICERRGRGTTSWATTATLWSRTFSTKSSTRAAPAGESSSSRPGGVSVGTWEHQVMFRSAPGGRAKRGARGQRHVEAACAPRTPGVRQHASSAPADGPREMGL